MILVVEDIITIKQPILMAGDEDEEEEDIEELDDEDLLDDEDEVDDLDEETA